VTVFTGFTTEAWEFLDGLAADNTSDYFNDHRERYRECVATTSAAFVDALTPALERVHPGLQGEARVGRSLFRINRDTRFGHDKTPYKTYLDFLFWIGDGEPRRSPACIIRLATTTVLTGAGQIGLTGAALDRYRTAVAGSDGAQLRAVVDQLVATGSELSEPSRARVPSPYPPAHPNADLLRRDGFHLTHTNRHPDELGDERIVTWTADELARYAPLLRWLADTT
jgi:uncharacterized protein (TIGR02453 family)